MNLAIKWKDLAVLLLPVFFLLHEWNARFVMLDLQKALLLLIYYCLASVVMYLLCLLIFRKRVVSFLACNLTGFIFFFFGKFADVFSIAALKYAFLLLFIMVLLVWVLYRLLSSSEKLTLRFNTFSVLLLSIYVIIEIGTLVINVTSDRSKQTAQIRATYKPDIYLLVFDEYTSSKALLKYYGYNNYKFDSFLVRNSFVDIPLSKSNYNFTFFSIASLLNSKYVAGTNTEAINYIDFLKVFSGIRNSSTQDFLENSGYEIKNYSVFNLRGYKAKYGLNIAAFDEEGIFQQTLAGRLIHLWKERFGKKEWQQGKYLKEFRERFANLVLAEKEAAKISAKPKFVYAHVLAPHEPFYTDSLGNLNISEAGYKSSVAKDPVAYTAYLSYCNTKIEEAISIIMKATQNKAVIIVIGDHGLRKTNLKSIDNEHHFMNMMAVHLPNGQQPSGEIPNSPVNIFPFIFNNIFNMQQRFLPDSSVFLRLSTHLTPI